MNSPILEMSSFGLTGYCQGTYVREVNHLVAVNCLCDLVDPVGDLFRSGSTVVAVELDTKVVVWTSRVVGSGEEDTTIRLLGTDQGRGRRGGQNSVDTDEQVLDAVTSCETENDLNGFRRLRWG